MGSCRAQGRAGRDLDGRLRRRPRGGPRLPRPPSRSRALRCRSASLRDGRKRPPWTASLGGRGRGAEAAGSPRRPPPLRGRTARLPLSIGKTAGVNTTSVWTTTMTAWRCSSRTRRIYLPRLLQWVREHHSRSARGYAERRWSRPGRGPKPNEGGPGVTPSVTNRPCRPGGATLLTQRSRLWAPAVITSPAVPQSYAPRNPEHPSFGRLRRR